MEAVVPDSWTVRCWVFNSLLDKFQRFHFGAGESLLCNDVVEAAKCLIGTALHVAPTRLALFFIGELGEEDPSHISRSDIQQGVSAISPASATSHRLEDVLELVLHYGTGAAPPLRPEIGRSDSSFFTTTTSSADAVVFERSKLLCELPGFTPNLLVVVIPLSSHHGAEEEEEEDCVCHDMVTKIWPRFSRTAKSSRSKGPFELPAVIQVERALSKESFTLIETPKALGDIGEAIAMHQCVIEFSAPLLPSMTPEYMFHRVGLSKSIPFSMCRSLLGERSCQIRVYTGDLDDEKGSSLRREWPFRTLRCQKSLRPTGIIFRVKLPEREAFANVEWYPSGFFRVCLEACHLELRIGVIPPCLEERLISLARSVLNEFLANAFLPVALPDSADDFSFRIVDIQLNYTAFAAVTNIKLLVDDKIRQSFFLEAGSKNTSSSESRGSKDKSVSLIYMPSSIRRHTFVGSNSVRCNIIRSTSNGVLCRIRLRGLSLPFGVGVMLVMSAASMIRYSIVQSLPREFAETRSTMNLQHVDPELHHSVKNSGLSRKIWKFTDRITKCKRPRRPVPINLHSQRDMERYHRAEESQWMMWYRGVWYAAVDDENENGETIRKHRLIYEEGMREKNEEWDQKRKNTPADYSKELRFFNAVVLKEITEKAYRTPGYEGEEFRFFPACIRYRGVGTMTTRSLKIMSPLYRQGLVKFRGRGAADIKAQLMAFNQSRSSSGGYVIKANKTLGAGDMGELPQGAVYDWARKAAPPKAKMLRKGVQRDKDRRFSSLHALLTALQVQRYTRLAPVKAERFVRAYWRTLRAKCEDRERQVMDIPSPFWAEEADEDSIGVSAFNEAMCQLISLVHTVNVVVFHYSYTSPRDVNVVFSGARYRDWLRTIILLKTTNASHFEPIILEGDDDEEIPESEIAHLFESFYPEQHQHNLRLRLLRDLFEDSTVTQVVHPETRKQCGLLFSEVAVPLPVVHGPVNLSIPCLEQPLFYSVPGGVRSLFDVLYNISRKAEESELQAYRPKYALVGQDQWIFALVLNDTRLICRFSRGVKAQMIVKWSRGEIEIVNNLSLKSPFMGLSGTPVLPNSERHLALHLPPNGHDAVRLCFKQLISNIAGWISSSTRFSQINAQKPAAKRRAEIRKTFVQPAIDSMRRFLPISEVVMAEMLTAFMDHHPDHTKWLDFLESVSASSLSNNNNNNQSSGDVLAFDSPEEYLKWLVRQE